MIFTLDCESIFSVSIAAKLSLWVAKLLEWSWDAGGDGGGVVVARGRRGVVVWRRVLGGMGGDVP